MGLTAAIDVRMMINGLKFCFAKFMNETTVERVQNPDAICGNQDPLLQRTASGRRQVSYSTYHDITVPVLETLLPLMGTTNVSGTYTVNQQSPPTCHNTIDLGGAIHKFTNSRINRAIIRGQQGTMPCSIECQWIADDEEKLQSATWVEGAVDNIMAFPGTTYSANSLPYKIDRFAFVIDRKLVTSFNASPTLTDVGSGPRQTMLATTIPYIPDNADVYWSNRDSTLGIPHALAITNGGDTLTINIPKGVLVPEGISVPGALGEVRLPLTWEAHRQYVNNADVPAFNLVLQKSNP